MFPKTYPEYRSVCWRACFSLFLVAALLYGALPAAPARANSSADLALDQEPPGSDRFGSSRGDSENPYTSSMPSVKEGKSEVPYTRPSTSWYPAQEESMLSNLLNSDRGYVLSNQSFEVGADGTLPLPTSAVGGSLPAGFNVRSIMPGITVDLTYNVVAGLIYDDRGESVTVTMGADGYGAAEVDDAGFFWTPIWHTTDGYAMDLECGDSISVVVGSDPAKIINPPCLTGGINILTETVHGSIAGDTGGTSLHLKIGYMNTELDEMQRLNPQPPKSGGGVSDSTQGDGSFSYDYSWIYYYNLGAESLISVDYAVGDGYARTYLYPDTPVFMIQQSNIIAGYAEIGQAVTATVYEGAGPGERWSDLVSAYGPHGFYTFITDPQIEVGDVVEVVLDGGPTLSTTAVDLGDFDFDAAGETLTGSAPDGTTVRASLWQWDGGNHRYRNLHVSATSGDIFSMDFTSDPYTPVDLRARDDVLVVAEDTNGNQVQVLSGPPFVSAYVSLDSDWDCAYGRLDGPDLPIVVTLDKGGGDTYTRVTGHTTDMGNRLQFCYVIRDAEDNFVDFSPGNIVTLIDGTPGWEGSVEVVDFTWSGDTSGNDINGTTANGDLEVNVSQWRGELYPVYGVDTTQVPVTGGSFSAGYYGFDIRDSVMIDFAHFHPVTGFSTETNAWGYQPTLPYYEVNIPNGVGGMVGSPGETVTAQLYDGATLLAETSEDKDDDPYRFWLDEFDGHWLQPGYRVVVSSGGWTAEMIIPDLSIEGDVDTDMLTANGPDGLLFLEVNNNNEQNWQEMAEFVPASPAKWDVSQWGWDLQLSDWVSVTYQAVDGNRAYYRKSMHELSEVNLWLDYGARDWMWGTAQPGSTVTAERDSTTLFSTTADPGGNWGIENPLDLYPGDTITVTAGAGVYPVVFDIPDPMTVEANAETDVVSGQIDGFYEAPVEVLGNWEDGYRELLTNTSGEYSTASDPYVDIPKGADGYIRFRNMVNYATVTYRQYFREPSLLMDVNYAHDWIEGGYEPGHHVVLTVTESDGATVKGTAEMDTGEIPWWGGGTGFSTSNDDPWIGEQPDIMPGDWVFGEADNGYSNTVHIGTITGEVDLDSNTISGTVNAPWLPQAEAVQVWCHPNTEEVEGKGDWVLPNGIDLYVCDWNPATEWDIPPNHDIGVSYFDPGGYLDPARESCAR